MMMVMVKSIARKNKTRVRRIVKCSRGAKERAAIVECQRISGKRTAGTGSELPALIRRNRHATDLRNSPY